MDNGKCSGLDNEYCYINMSKCQHFLALKKNYYQNKYFNVQLS